MGSGDTQVCRCGSPYRCSGPSPSAGVGAGVEFASPAPVVDLALCDAGSVGVALLASGGPLALAALPDGDEGGHWKKIPSAGSTTRSTIPPRSPERHADESTWTIDVHCTAKNSPDTGTGGYEVADAGDVHGADPTDIVDVGRIAELVDLTSGRAALSDGAFP